MLPSDTATERTGDPCEIDVTPSGELLLLLLHERVTSSQQLLRTGQWATTLRPYPVHVAAALPSLAIELRSVDTA
ncbi:hypothetical protein OG945_34875 [Streptomyces decoyicus]